MHKIHERNNGTERNKTELVPGGKAAENGTTALPLSIEGEFRLFRSVAGNSFRVVRVLEGA